MLAKIMRIMEFFLNKASLTSLLLSLLTSLSQASS